MNGRDGRKVVVREAFTALKKGQWCFSLTISNTPPNATELPLFDHPATPVGDVLGIEPNGDAHVVFSAEEVLLYIGDALGMDVGRIRSFFAAKRAEIEENRT